MSTQETEAQPTPGPACADGRYIVAQPEGGPPNGEVIMSPSGYGNDVPAEEQRANAQLTAAAFTAAHELPDEYDPIEAVRASSDVFPALKKFVGQGGDHAPRCGYKIGYACDCGLQDLKDALASAQDDGN